VFLLVVAVAVVGGYFAWHAVRADRPAKLAVFALVMAGWVVTLCLHEFAHAFLAWRFGDDEIAARGYLTLNPLRYSHPLLSIVLPVLFIAIGGIGLPGGAVYLHPHRFRTDLQRALVSLAGPLTNVLFAVVLLALTAAYAPGSQHPALWSAVAFLGLLQITAAMLNLLPIPGLDGWGAVEPYLDPSVRRGAEQFKPFGMLLVFALLQVAGLNRAFFSAVYWLYDLSGVSRGYSDLGYALVQFWR
jgi:Zn-dependent protease